ncbi:MAG TPA: AAA family ATPase, partial [Pyrinomonadaceae bacterium]|nr:AAA family ATPase [Pyrinomonadaceae bacterium]
AESEAFVGREPELVKLNELLAQSVRGEGRVVFITGEPGIGKSSLVHEFLRRARKQQLGVVIAHGRSVEQYGTGEAYLPFLEAIGSLLTGPHRERIVALLRTYAPTWCLQFPAAFVSSIAIEKLQQETAGASKERMLREMGDMLTALSSNSPVVLLLEDLHWADPSSIDLLRHLGQRVADQRLLIIGTMRPEELELSTHPLKMFKLDMQSHRASEKIALGSLTQAHLISYLDSHFKPNDFPRELASLIHHKTEGHPLFATSLIQFLAETGDITRVDEHWTLARPLSKMALEAPENVRSMIRKKIQALSEEDRRALQYASVEGEEFLSTVAAHLLGVDDLDLEERLATVERTHGLIEARGEEDLPDGSLATRYRFAHALYQDVLYADMVAKRRVLLHRQAGEKLAAHYGKQSARIAAKLAVHFERGRDFPRAVEYLTHAGDNAARLFANTEASEHYGHALKLVKKNEDAREDERLLALYHKRGKINFARGLFQKSVDDFTEMLELARTLGSTAQESVALNALTMTLFYSHRLDEITARADEILRTAERAGSEHLRIEAMQVLALKHLGDGELDKARPMLDQIIEGARRLKHQSILLSSLAWRGLLHFFQTEYAEAEEMLKEAQALAKELRDSFLLLETYFVLGMVRGNMGRMTEALETFREGLELSDRYEDQFWGPRMPNCVGWIYRELQDFERAIEHDERGLRVGREINVLEAQANSLINLGIDRGRAGLESESTMDAFREVEAIFQKDSWFRWRYSIRLQAGKSEHALAAGDTDAAEEHARRLLEVATQYGARKYKAVAHKLLSEVSDARGDVAAAEAELSSALAELETHPVPVVAWKAHAALGSLLARKGDAQGAAEAFARAVEIVKAIADGVKDEEQRALFMSSNAIRKLLESDAGSASHWR